MIFWILAVILAVAIVIPPASILEDFTIDNANG